MFKFFPTTYTDFVRKFTGYQLNRKTQISIYFLSLIARTKKSLFALLMIPAFLPAKAESQNKAQAVAEFGFIKKDTNYYTKSLFKNLYLIYSEDLKNLSPFFSNHIKKADQKLSKTFSRNPYFRPNYIIFPSSRYQLSSDFATAYPLSFVNLYPVGAIYPIMDKRSIFNWLDNSLIHEMTHIYQLSQNTGFDRWFYRILGPLAHRNFLLSSWISEGSAVLNESKYALGGRLYSGWARAFVFAQIKKGISLKPLLKPYNDPFSSMEQYLHGAYFFAYLHSLYSMKKINKLFEKSGSFLPVGFWGLNSAFKRAFRKDLTFFFEGYKKYYGQTAKKQNSSPEKALIKSKAGLPINSGKNKIYFLISDVKSPPQLVIFDKKTNKIKKKEVNLPFGKIFYNKGNYYSAGQGRTSASSTEYSLFKEGFEPLKKYNSQYVMDFYKNKFIALDTKENHSQNRLFLNQAFYDNVHSSAVMDHLGRVYYFKQKGDKRTLYRDKKPVFSFNSHYGYPVEADEEGVYFIGATKFGSSLFVYIEEAGVFRLSLSDTITYARKIKKNKFLVSEITPTHYKYKIISTEKMPEEPVLYAYSFKKQNIFENKERPFEWDKESSKEMGPAALSLNNLKDIIEQNNSLAFNDLPEDKESDWPLTHLEKQETTSNILAFYESENQQEGSIGEKKDLSNTVREKNNKDKLASSTGETKTLPGKKLSKRWPARQEQNKSAGSLIKDKKPASSLKLKSGLWDKKNHTNSNQIHITTHKNYSAFSQLSLSQIILLGNPKTFCLDKKSFCPGPFLLSFFQFLDPLNINELILYNLFAKRKKFFRLSYNYKKYRPQLSLSLIYDETYLSKKGKSHHIQLFKELGLLEREDIPSSFKNQPLKKRNYILARDRAVDLSWSYPLILKTHWVLLWANSFQWGQKQLNSSKSFWRAWRDQIKPWKSYLQHKGELKYSYKRKYRYSYSFHKKRVVKLSYNARAGQPFSKQLKTRFSWQAQFFLTEEIGREWFASFNGSMKKNLWDPEESLQTLSSWPEEENMIFPLDNSSEQNIQNLYKLNFQILKALNYSYYPLKLPLSLRRLVPLMGLSFLSAQTFKQKKYKPFLIPFAGIEGELSFFYERNPWTVGLGGEYVIDWAKKPFVLKSSHFYLSFWLRGIL